MSPKAKKTLAQLREEDAAASRRLQLAARTIKYKSQVRDIHAALKRYPEYAPNVIENLTGLGVNWEELGIRHDASEAKEEIDTPFAAAVPGLAEAEVRSADAGSSATTLELNGESEASPNQYGRCDPLPSCYTTVGLLSVVVMRHYLRCVEKVTFSEHSIKALALPGKKTIAKSTIQELWEFVFGLGPEESIAPTWHTPGSFELHLCALNESVADWLAI